MDKKSMNNQDIEEKLSRYEHFIEYKLKIDLKQVEETLRIKNVMYQEWDEVENMSKTVQEFKEKDRDMNLKFELANGVMAQSEVTDFNCVYVDIGLGYMLDMEPDEAIKYATIRKNILKKEVEHYRKLAVDIKVHIKFVLLALNELQATLTSPGSNKNR